MEERALELKWVNRCLQGDQAAQRELYDRFRRRLYGICMRYARSEVEAQDFLQEGFIKIFRELKNFRADGPLGAWMSRIMVNTAISQLRKRRLEFSNEDKLHRKDDGLPNAIDHMQAEELIQLIQQLPSGYRTVFNLYAMEGYSHGEIADLLGISEGTSRSQYLRAKKALQAMIKALKLH